MKWVYTYHEYDDTREFLKAKELKAGDAVLVYSQTILEKDGKEIFYIDKDYASEGYPGNSNGSIKRFHGWRGTTNDVSTCAYGVYTIKSVECTYSIPGNKFSERIIKIRLNKTDIKKDED